MIMTHRQTENQSQKLVGSKGRVETCKWTDVTDCITLSSNAVGKNSKITPEVITGQKREPVVPEEPAIRYLMTQCITKVVSEVCHNSYCCKCSNVFSGIISNSSFLIRCYKFLLHLFINDKTAFIRFLNYRPIHILSAYH